MYFRKILFLISVFFLFTKVTYSQNFEAHIIGGFNISQVDGDKLSGYNKLGLVFGGITSFNINEDWNFQQEIVYFQRGSRATDKQLTLDNFQIRRIDYIDFLLQVERSIQKNWSAVLGMGYGAFINVKSDVPENNSLYIGDIIGVIGIRYQLSEILSLVLKGQYSLQPIFSNQDSYNNAISVTFRFKLI
jgi:hypothetical protein